MTKPSQKSLEPSLIEKRFNLSTNVFRQEENANYVACNLLHWLTNSQTLLSFERIEPRIFSGSHPITPDMIASYDDKNHGLIVEIKSERSDTYLPKEGKDLRGQLEAYIEGTSGWPTHTEGATRELEHVDVMFISHYTNAETYLKEIMKSEKLKEALKNNLALFVWEIVEARSGHRLRVRYHTGECREPIDSAFKSSVNGYAVDIKDLGVILNNFSIRLKLFNTESLLVLITQKALSLTDPSVTLSNGMVSAEKPAYVDEEQIFFILDALYRYINSEEDIGKKKYMSHIERRTFDNSLTLLVDFGVMQKVASSIYYSISTAKRVKEITDTVLRPYAEYLVEKGGNEKETAGYVHELLLPNATQKRETA